MIFGNRMFMILGACALVVAGAGLVVGKKKEKAFLEALQVPRDFMLLDDADDVFQLNKMPANQRVFLIFTPDGIPTAHVKPFADFSRYLPEFAKRQIQVKMITRMNKEIVANFKRAAHFEARVLVDMSGAVGRAAGAWPTLEPVGHWHYALVDNHFNILWEKRADVPLAYEAIARELPNP